MSIRIGGTSASVGNPAEVVAFGEEYRIADARSVVAAVRDGAGIPPTSHCERVTAG